MPQKEEYLRPCFRFFTLQAEYVICQSGNWDIDGSNIEDWIEDPYTPISF